MDVLLLSFCEKKLFDNQIRKVFNFPPKKNLYHRVEISVAFHYYFFLLNQPNYRLPFIAKTSSGCFEIEQGLVSGLIKQQDHFVLKAVLSTLPI